MSPLSRQLDRQADLHIQHKDTDRGFRCLPTLNTMIDTTAGKHWGVYHTQTHNNIQHLASDQKRRVLRHYSQHEKT
jgi:hypothetical protein